MNIERLRAVQTAIQDDELLKAAGITRFRMDCWLAPEDEHKAMKDYSEMEPGDAWCGTSACVAGTAMAMFNPTVNAAVLTHDVAALKAEWSWDPDEDIDQGTSRAAEVLGLDIPVAQKLFYVSSWPYAWESLYWELQGRGQSAELVAQVIDILIDNPIAFMANNWGNP